MVPGTHPAVRTDRTLCPGLDIRHKVPAAQVPAGIGLEEYSLVPAFIAPHFVFLMYTGGMEMLNLVPFLWLVSKDVIL